MAESDFVTAFRSLFNTVDDFIAASKPLGKLMTDLAYLVRKAFECELEFIAEGISCRVPDEANLNRMLQPLSDVIQQIQAFRETNRHVEDLGNHFATISESIVVLSWISVRPLPLQFIKDMIEAGEYFGNRVLAANKGQSVHTNWIRQWKLVLKSVELYVANFHSAGFEWNISNATTVMFCAHPPPPPPPPTTVSVAEDVAGGDDRTALLNELNQGLDITNILRPATRRTVAAAAASPPGQGVTASSRPAPYAVRAYPPKFFLDGKKHRVEHQKDNFTLKIEPSDMSESLAMFKCENCGIEVTGKINGATVDNCKRTTVVLNDIIASVEAIHCERLKIQCNGHVPLISLDNCDSVQIFLTDKSQDVEIISSKSTSCNVCLLAPDGDYSEIAMPEQIKSILVDRRLQSSVVEKN